MTASNERVRFPTPPTELERRWSGVRKQMEAAGIDVLIIHNHVQGLGGYVKWFADTATANGYPVSIVFPRSGPMTLVMHGPHGADRPADTSLHGVERVLCTWSFQSASFTARDDADALVRALRDAAPDVKRVGLVGLAQIPFGLVESLRSELAGVEFFDGADAVDGVKAVKSLWEQEAIGRTVAMQVKAFEAALDAIAPGVREWEVIAAAQRVALAHGSESGIYMIGSGQPGEPAIFNPPRKQNRVLQTGDRLTLLLEPSGPDGMFAEFGRTIVLGKADDALIAEHAFTTQAWKTSAATLRPGVSCAQAFADYNAFMREHGRPEEDRLHCHGQGYDLVERPLVRSDESMTLMDGALLALHPMYVHAGAACFVCDNVFVGPDGVGAPLHGLPQKVFEI
jgi:Xaa-Pro aminopeptidase